jgi:hypothetical protein
MLLDQVSRATLERTYHTLGLYIPFRTMSSELGGISGEPTNQNRVSIERTNRWT